MLSKEQIQNSLKDAQVKKDEILVSTLRMLIAAINNKEIEKRTKLSKTEPIEKLEELSKLTNDEIMEVLSSEIKKRKDAAEGFEKGGRKALAEKEKKEMEILQKYLPEQISEEEIRELVKEAVDKTGAKQIKDMGRVMAELMPKVKGKADGGLVSKIVKEMLTPQNG